MIDLKLNIDDETKEYTIPETWSEVTVGDYMRFAAIDHKGKTELQLLSEIISAFSGIAPQHVELLQWEDFEMLIEKMEFVQKPMPNVTLKDSIMVGDQEYWLKKDFNQINVAERISIAMIISKNGERIDKSMDELLCVFLRQKDETGKMEPYTSALKVRTKEFRTIPIMEVHNLFLFFSTGTNIFDKTMKGSSAKNEK